MKQTPKPVSFKSPRIFNSSVPVDPALGLAIKGMWATTFAKAPITSRSGASQSVASQSIGTRTDSDPDPTESAAA
jgi:hypothetical protein